MSYTLVRKIKKKGWPVYNRDGSVSKKWKHFHPEANKYVLKKLGSKIAKAVNKIKLPSNELLGSHTRGGKIVISKRVPKSLRKAIALHERIEHGLMTGNK